VARRAKWDCDAAAWSVAMRYPFLLA
jgi:hypothetical protein